MGMFSVHYLIERKIGANTYWWSGGPPKHYSSWSRTGGIRIFAKKDAEDILERLMKASLRQRDFEQTRVIESE